MNRRQIVLYGDVNLNILDGSATWLVSLAETLALTDSMIHVVLKAHPTTGRLLTRISDHPQVRIHPPVTRPGYSVMSQSEAVSRLEEVLHEVDAHILIVRGREMAAAAAQSSTLAAHLWSYVTDFTFPAPRMPAGQLSQLRDIAERSHRFFAQTEETRSFIEAIIPEAAGKCLLMTPTIPDEFFVPIEDRETNEPLGLVYSGKLHPDWKTLESTELPARLEAVGCEAVLTILGDKVYSPEPLWITAMQSVLDEPPPGVTWAGGIPREEALQIIAAQDLGLSWRSGDLDSSLEISTKMLEYAASGTPPVLNRTSAHEALFGQDYPLFVDDTIESVVEVVAGCRTQLPALRSTVQAAVRPYASSATAQRMEGYFQRSEAGPEHVLRWSGAADAAMDSRSRTMPAFDHEDFRRPKHPGAHHTIGMMGFVPFATRPDRALDLLEALLEHDSGFRLLFMGTQPWECSQVWNSGQERDAYLEFFDRIGATPGLLDHVVFGAHREDTANWLRNTGWVAFLSPSESAAPMLQAMASAAIPLVLGQPTDAEPLGEGFVHPTIDTMATSVLELINDDDARESRARDALHRVAGGVAAPASTTSEIS